MDAKQLQLDRSACRSIGTFARLINRSFCACSIGARVFGREVDLWNRVTTPKHRNFPYALEIWLLHSPSSNTPLCPFLFILFPRLAQSLYQKNRTIRYGFKRCKITYAALNNVFGCLLNKKNMPMVQITNDGKIYELL